MSWFAIRTIYHFGVKSDGRNIFEERIVAFEAESWDEAHEKAEAEAEQYAEANDFVAHPDQVGYEQDGERLVDGYEIWSELYESPLSLEAFHAERYERYEYEPEEQPA